eukprot:scaffold1380_cov374-Prasinococcus_capsulatus_cf.AAC.1
MPGAPGSGLGPVHHMSGLRDAEKGQATAGRSATCALQPTVAGTASRCRHEAFCFRCTLYASTSEGTDRLATGAIAFADLPRSLGNSRASCANCCRCSTNRWRGLVTLTARGCVRTEAEGHERQAQRGEEAATAPRLRIGCLREPAAVGCPKGSDHALSCRARNARRAP